MVGEADTLWLIVATILVLTMQAGFLMLEGGRVRAKNSINVAQKNVTDLIVVWAIFFSGGSLLMFGLSISDLVDGAANGSQALSTTATPLHLISQAAFCSTAATILSGAVAERFSFRAYLVLIAVIAGLIYPVVGRMVWGDIYNPDASAWLADIGFIDFAGSTVVHGVGAWVALVAILMTGPRIGRFDKHGNPQVMPAHNAVIALFGVLVLLIGWMGFNGGAISISDPRLGSVLFNTLAAGVFGGCAGILCGVWMDKGVFNPTRVTSGLLGGLVACTASINYLTMNQAILVGGGGGFIATYGSHLLLHRFRIDDPLDAVATHGLAGVFGTLMVALVLPMQALPAASRMMQLLIQGLGIVVVAVFAGMITWISLSLFRWFGPVRVSEQAETLGLNYTEHGEGIGVERLQRTLEAKLEDNSSFAKTINVDSGDEHSELADTLNKVIGQYELASAQIDVARQRFMEFAQTASDWLWEADADMTLTFFHANADDKSRTSHLSDPRGRTLPQILSLTNEELTQLQTFLHRGDSPPVVETKLAPCFCPNETAVELRVIPVLDQQGAPKGYRGTLTDISIRKYAEERALHHSLHDELTGLPNRRALNQDLQSAIKRAIDENYSVVIAGVDLDGFKAVNDAYGHSTGDELLVQVAKRIRRFLRPVDIAYRTGGDEFVIVFDAIEPQMASQMAEAVTSRLISRLGESYRVSNLQVSVGASVGLSRFPQDHSEPEELLRMADLALYAAKEAGKRRVVSFVPAQDNDAQLQRQLEQDLHRAIANDEFFLMYQPQIDTVTESIAGYEALIRWHHPERGQISPGDFIPLAEKLKLLDVIGQIVLDKACRFAATWQMQDNGVTPRISVNVSPQQFIDPNFYDSVIDTMQRHQLEPQRLELEITEDVLVHDFTSVTDTLHRLRKTGIAIAVDDFGSGQTSLRYLNQFPLDTIKIDRSFIRHLGSSETTDEITHSMIKLSHTLGIDVVAEGVEETEQLELLRQWQCNQIQGFLYSRPLSSEHVIETMNQSLKKYGT